MSDKITVTVLPEKQLRHVLKREGYKLDGDGDYSKSGDPLFYFDNDMFKFCGTEIGVEFDGDGYTTKCADGWCFLKSWFVPYTLHGKTTDTEVKNV